jgi:hypothetical protein
MPSAIGGTYPEATFRIIHRDTIAACIQIVRKATNSIIKYSVHSMGFRTPELSKAMALQGIRRYTCRWPAVAQVGSWLDQYYQSVLEDAKLWFSSQINTKDVVNAMGMYLTPFPVSKSCHLHIGVYGLVSNRRLVALNNDRGNHDVAISKKHKEGVPADLYIIFRDMLQIAGWICEDSEARLYTKRFNLPASKSSKARLAKDGIRQNGEHCIDQNRCAVRS